MRKGNLHTIKNKGFDKNPQNINQNGRPRKLVSSVLKELEQKGIERVAPDQVVGIYECLLNLNQSELKEIVSDSEQPMLNRIVAKDMLDKKGFEVIEKMLDRVHGSAQKNVNLSGKIETETNVNININGIVNERLKEMPLNLMIVAMVAARAGIDPLVLMGDMAKSYYSQFSGFAKEPTTDTEYEPIDIKTINYDWNAIKSMYEPENKQGIKISDKERIKQLLNKNK